MCYILILISLERARHCWSALPLLGGFLDVLESTFVIEVLERFDCETYSRSRFEIRVGGYGNGIRRNAAAANREEADACAIAA